MASISSLQIKKIKEFHFRRDTRQLKNENYTAQLASKEQIDGSQEVAADFHFFGASQISRRDYRNSCLSFDSRARRWNGFPRFQDYSLMAGAKQRNHGHKKRIIIKKSPKSCLHHNSSSRIFNLFLSRAVKLD